MDARGLTILIADAHGGDGKRFVLRADEKLTASVELEIGDSRDQVVKQAVHPLASA